MKCPYRMNEVHTCCNEKTYIYKEFAECYKEACPYWGELEPSVCGCLKAEKEC